MPNWFWNFIGCCFRAVISLRYRIEIRGLETLTSERLNRNGGILFLPNHPALMDPLIVSSWLWPKFRMRPLVVQHIYDLTAFKPLAMITDAIPIPEFETSVNEFKLKQAANAFSQIAEGLKKGNNFIIFPSGHLKSSGKEILGGASGTHELLKTHPDTNIVLIRTTGLWGSSFSRALEGRTPSFPEITMNGIKTVLKNFIFFVPKRKILIELEANPEGRPEGENGSRVEFNRYLENWYNRYPDDQGNIHEEEPLKLVSYSFWKEDLPKVFERKKRSGNGAGAEVSEEVKKKIYDEIKRILDRPDQEITPEQNLAMDLGMDSLNIADFIAFLTKNFNIEELHPEDMDTVESVFELIEMNKEAGPKKDHPKVNFTWKKEKNRPSPQPPIGTSLAEAFLNSCQRMDGFAACGDDLIGVMSYKKLKTAALVLAQYFRGWEESRVAVMLPASIGSYIVIMALQLAGKVPVMMNWTLGAHYLEEMMNISEARGIVSSLRFIHRLQNVQFGRTIDQLVLLEDIRKSLSLKMKLKGAFLAHCSVKYVLRTMNLNRISENDPAVILFTSGSEATPKGVPLSHKNIISNLRAGMQCLKVNTDDIVYGILPPFHSFGFSIAGVFSILAGFRIAFYPDPTDGFALAEGVNRWKITIFCGAPTFIKGLFRAAHDEQLKSLRYVVSGAEKAPQELIDRVTKLGPGVKFIEGYGITECSPVLSISRPNLPLRGVGQLLPGIELITIHPETLELLDKGAEGEICVRGPNIFQGYLGNPRTPFIEINGKQWYRTGDLGYLDPDGYLILSGRLKRFVKLGGEMISLSGVESAIATSLLQKGRTSPDLLSCAVCADEKEEGKPRLILFTIIDVNKEEINSILNDAGFSNIIKISEVRKIAEIPVMGAGKINYRELQALI